MTKFKVIVIAENFTIGEPILHYIKVEDNIRDVLLKYYIRNLNVTFENLREHLNNEILKNIDQYPNLVNNKDRIKDAAIDQLYKMRVKNHLVININSIIPLQTKL